MRRRFTVRTGLETFGPLHDDPPKPPTGDPAPSGTGSGDPAGNGGGGTTPPAPATPPATGDMIPKARFDEILNERNALAREKEQREQKELTDKGEHEKVAQREKARADANEAKAASYARKLAFVTSATGKVSDVAAAHKLAAADGLLDFELDDDGNAKDPKAVETMIGELVKTYQFLKPGPQPTGRGYGADHGATDGGAPVDPDKLSPIEKMELGIKAGSRG